MFPRDVRPRLSTLKQMAARRGSVQVTCLSRNYRKAFGFQPGAVRARRPPSHAIKRAVLAGQEKKMLIGWRRETNLSISVLREEHLLRFFDWRKLYWQTSPVVFCYGCSPAGSSPPFERRWSVRSRRSPPHIICAGAPSPPGMMRSRWTRSASAVSRRDDAGRSALRPMNLLRWSANRLTRFARACRRTSRIILSVGFAKRCCTFGAVPDRRNLPVSAHHPRLTLC